MKEKEKHIVQAEIKVKNLLSELYESESAIQKEILKTKEKLGQKISDLELQYNDVMKKRKELQTNFEHLKTAGNVEWEKAKKDFDLLLNYIEGDKDTFIQKAELLIKELGIKIQEFENKARDAATEVKNDLTEKAEALKIYKNELQDKIDSIKDDSGDRWREIKHWFIEKSKSVKEYIALL